MLNKLVSYRRLGYLDKCFIWHFNVVVTFGDHSARGKKQKQQTKPGFK